MMLNSVRTTAEADQQILIADEWWISNRSSVPDLFARELADAFDRLRRLPKLGRPYRVRGASGVRRLYMPATRYHVYYLHDPDAHEVVVLAVWSAVRGKEPPLGRPRRTKG
jgi:plasmid stabilization system protein ParE